MGRILSKRDRDMKGLRMDLGTRKCVADGESGACKMLRAVALLLLGAGGLTFDIVTPAGVASEVAVRLNGAIRHTASIKYPGQYTNHFQLTVSSDRYLLKLRDQEGRLTRQSTFDGVDVGHWWKRKRMTNAQDTAWVSELSKYDSSKHGLPLSSRENLIVVPLLWSCPDLTNGAFAFFSDSYAGVESFNPSSGAQISTNVLTASLHDDAGRLQKREYYQIRDPRYAALNPRTSIFDAEFSDYEKAGDYLMPRTIVSHDRRQGFSFVQQYAVSVDSVETLNAAAVDWHPDLSQADTFMNDLRLGGWHTVADNRWPARGSGRIEKHTSRIRAVRAAFLILFLILPALLVLQQLKRNQKRKVESQ